MTRVAYTKPALTYQEQLQQLKTRGLQFSDEGSFLKLLERKSYYRLSGYWYPLLADKENHFFKANASFDDAYQMYQFDRALRQLISNELEKIEVAVRAKMVYVMSLSHDSFWYTDSSLFRDQNKHSLTLSKINVEYKRSDAKFIQSFKQKYADPLPPSWTVFEIITIGTLSTLYKNLKPGRSKRAIANYFGVNDKAFSSWLHSLVYVRNVCAHHSRLWNRELRIQPSIPQSLSNQWIDNKSLANNKVYIALCILMYLLHTVDGDHQFAVHFKKLLSEYPNIDSAAMGFPKDWTNEPLWQTN